MVIRVDPAKSICYIPRSVSSDKKRFVHQRNRLCGWRTRDNRKHFATELGFRPESGWYRWRRADCFAPESRHSVGYGYAILAGISVPAATTIDLFAGPTPLGSISFTGVPDPIFTGGFAGVASDTPFDGAVLTFSNASNAFAVDNVTFSANKASDEGQTLILLSAGISVLLFLRAGRGGPNPSITDGCRITGKTSLPHRLFIHRLRLYLLVA